MIPAPNTNEPSKIHSEYCPIQFNSDPIPVEPGAPAPVGARVTSSANAGAAATMHAALRPVSAVNPMRGRVRLVRLVLGVLVFIVFSFCGVPIWCTG